jgi:hypothetical protein
MCFSAIWLVQTLVWLVVICVIVAILHLLVPRILAWMGIDGSLIVQVIRIVIGAIVLIALIWFLYDLYVCGTGGRRLVP